METEENKYHFAREVIFNLRTCHAITPEVYNHWIDKLIEDDNKAKDNDVLGDVSETFTKGELRDAYESGMNNKGDDGSLNESPDLDFDNTVEYIIKQRGLNAR